MMVAPSYALWHAELKHPTPEDRRADRSTEPAAMSGFWRINSARTKPDYPVAIWTDAGKSVTMFQIGRKLMNTEQHAKEWQDFVSGAWLKCTAVYQSMTDRVPAGSETWSEALDTGRWKDGKPAREVTAAEKADIIPSTPASQGGNQPVDENGEPIDEVLEQVKSKLASARDKIKALGIIDSMEKANQVAAILEPARAVWGEGEAERKRRKKPHDDAADAVQAQWVPILEPAKLEFKAANDAAVAFGKREEARLRKEAEDARRAEEKRIADEIAEQKKREAAEQARQAEAMGIEHSGPTEEEIEAEAQQQAAAQVADAPMADTKVRIGTEHGRALSAPKVAKGSVAAEDRVKFLTAVADHVDTIAFIEKKANALARAKASVPGLTIL